MHSSARSAIAAWCQLSRDVSVRGIVALGVIAIGCGDDPPRAPTQPTPLARTVSALVIEAPSTMLEVGQTVMLTARASYSDGSDGTVVAGWQSSDPAVATVDVLGLVTAVGAGTSSITATSGGHMAAVDIHVEEPLGRSTADRRDDIGGSQLHVMYVLPSNGEDRQLDMDRTIATSIEAIQNWLSGATSRAFRLDTFGGRLDVTFYRLAMSDAEAAGLGAFLVRDIERELSAAGRLAGNKIYLVYYGGRNNQSCGSAAWPPAVPGSVGVLYINGEPAGAPPCNTNPLGASPTRMGYWEYSGAHEMFHVLGAVATCAPNHTLAGHVSEDPTDLMYAGSQPWQPQFVDIGRDDYFGHDNGACLDIEDSPFLEPSRGSMQVRSSGGPWRSLSDTR